MIVTENSGKNLDIQSKVREVRGKGKIAVASVFDIVYDVIMEWISKIPLESPVP
jgi:hypothetical protein